MAECLLGAVGVLNTLDLDQAGARVGNMARALVAQVTSPNANASAKHPIFSKKSSLVFGCVEDWGICGADREPTQRLRLLYRVFSLRALLT